MQKNYNPNLNMWALDTDAAHILHRKGSADFPEIRHTHVADADLPAWEEIALAEAEAVKQAREAEAAYKARVVALIRVRYDADDETAILRQRDSKPEEFTEYNAFVEECKADAKILLVREKAEREAEFAAAQKAAQSEGEVEAQAN